MIVPGIFIKCPPRVNPIMDNYIDGSDGDFYMSVYTDWDGKKSVACIAASDSIDAMRKTELMFPYAKSIQADLICKRHHNL